MNKVLEKKWKEWLKGHQNSYVHFGLFTELDKQIPLTNESNKICNICIRLSNLQSALVRRVLFTTAELPQVAAEIEELRKELNMISKVAWENSPAYQNRPKPKLYRKKSKG